MSNKRKILAVPKLLAVLVSIYCAILSGVALALTYSGFVEDRFWFISGLKVVGSTVYFVEADAPGVSSFQIIDASNPDQPILLTRYDTLDFAVDVDVFGSLAYVADTESGLRIFDVSNSTNPTEIGLYEPAFLGGSMAVAINGSVAYVADTRVDGGLSAIDVSIASMPQLISVFDQENGGSVLEVIGNRLYALVGNSLKIYDVSVPSDPTELGRFDFATTMTGFAVTGNYLYAVSVLQPSEGDILILDITNPGQISAAGSFTVAVNDFGARLISDITIDGNLAYLAGKNLRVLDITDPLNPVELGLIGFNSGLGAEHVQIVNGYAYVTVFLEGLRIIDLENPNYPRLSTPGENCSFVAPENCTL